MMEKENSQDRIRQEILKKIIKELHAGTPVEKLQKTFAKLIKNTSPEEIADMENSLIQEGFPPSEIQRLCDVHVEVFNKSLSKVGKPSKMPGHPIYTFIEENKETKKRLKNLLKIVKRLKKGKQEELEIENFESNFNQFKELEKHYTRKENQLFPLLEAKKFTGPTQVMWGKHDEIRQHIKKTESLFKEKDWLNLFKQTKTLASAIQKMIFLEEKILYPTSAKKLNDSDWIEIKKGGSEIGYAWITPSNLWDVNIAKQKAIQEVNEHEQEPQLPKKDNTLKLSQGQLTQEQIDLMLKQLPIDITFVDENNKVRYYSDTKERIFPRSSAIIGRAVQNCHPPKSVHIVEDIIEKFKDKKKEVAEFWIQMGGKFIHIRYFPVYDQRGIYKGIVEVSQDITQIKTLDGEQRLMD
jgi:DUF438 domain-containing protein